MKFRHECKQEISFSDFLQLKTRLSAVMKHDKYSGPDGTYVIKSLYFDNYMDKALREKQDGLNKREKFRIRYYGTDTSFIRVEKKSKINGLCSKEHARITKEECQSILDGDTAFLLQKEEPLFRELYAKMQYQVLRPKCIVAYTRETFVHPLGNVRVTLDTHICGSTRVQDFLHPELTFTHVNHTAILEVKWDQYLPRMIQDIVQMKNRKTSSFSKYAAVRI